MPRISITYMGLTAHLADSAVVADPTIPVLLANYVEEKMVPVHIEDLVVVLISQKLLITEGTFLHFFRRWDPLTDHDPLDNEST